MAELPKDFAKAKRYIERHTVDIAEADPYFRGLIYGRNGQHKTRTACTLPKPMFLIDIQEKGTKSARSMKGVKVFHAKTWKEIVWAYWYLKYAEHPYKSFGVDTLTGMQNVCMRQVLKESEDRDPTKDAKTPVQRDWLKVAELMKEQLLNFRNLPMHCIFTAQRRVRDDPEEETREIGPNLSPGVAATATACVDMIGHIYKKQRRVALKGGREKVIWEPRILVGPHDEYITKDRILEGKHNIIRNPDLGKIVEEMEAVEDGS